MISSLTYFDMNFENKFVDFLKKDKGLPYIMLPLDSQYSFFYFDPEYWGGNYVQP
jgi:hypothetical protein